MSECLDAGEVELVTPTTGRHGDNVAEPTRGRPRDLRAGPAILDAALDSFIEDGYQGMSIESIAARANVAKTTVYRRWSSKEELLLSAIETLLEDLHVPDSGDVEADLLVLVTRGHHFISKTKAGEVMPCMAVELATGTSLGRVYFKRILEPRLKVVKRVLEAGKARGELRADLDVQLATASIIGSMIFLRLSRTFPRRKGDFPDRLGSQLMDGMRK